MQTPFGNTPNTSAYNTYGAAIGSGQGYVLDKVSGAKMALSVRKLSALYSGYYARIRRTSDNDEQNVTALYGGFMNENAVLQNGQSITEWLSGAQAAGRTWFDQSGGVFHAQQSAATNQFPLRTFTANKPAFASFPNQDFSWNYTTAINPYLFGAGKQFSFHIVVKSTVRPSGDYRIFYHLNSSGALINGFTITLNGASQTGYSRISILLGDLINCANTSSLTNFPTAQPLHIIIRYDGTVNTSWIDRLKVTVNGNDEPMGYNSQQGTFPANLTQPVTTPRNWAPPTSLIQSGTSEIIFWDRLLLDSEVTWLTKNTQKSYGI